MLAHTVFAIQLFFPDYYSLRSWLSFSIQTTRPRCVFAFVGNNLLRALFMQGIKLFVTWLYVRIQIQRQAREAISIELKLYVYFAHGDLFGTPTKIPSLMAPCFFTGYEPGAHTHIYTPSKIQVQAVAPSLGGSHDSDYTPCLTYTLQGDLHKHTYMPYTAAPEDTSHQS